jgi:hypothetical protein
MRVINLNAGRCCQKGPSESRDLSPIENPEWIIKPRVEEQWHHSLEQVIAWAFQISESLEQTLIETLVDLMPFHLQTVMEANRGHLPS